MNIWKSTKVYSFFYGPRLEREHCRQSKILGIKCFKMLSRDNSSGFAKKKKKNGLKMRE